MERNWNKTWIKRVSKKTSVCAEVFKVKSIIQVPNQLGPQHFAGAKIKSLMLFLAPLFMPLYDFFLFV